MLIINSKRNKFALHNKQPSHYEHLGIFVKLAKHHVIGISSLLRKNENTIYYENMEMKINSMEIERRKHRQSEIPLKFTEFHNENSLCYTFMPSKLYECMRSDA